MDLQLSIGMAKNPRARAIFEGKVKPEGIDLVCTPLHASELFWRQLRFGDFDVSEMSVSSYMMEVAGGDNRWIGIPVFTTRRMFQFGILVRKDRCIDKPKDLRGKKMGVPEYQQTAALWTRGLLQHEYDVHARDMEFWMERNADHSQGGVTGFKPPEGVKLSYIPTSTNMVVFSIFRAFVQANELAEKARLEAVEYHLETGALPPQSRAALATPLIRHGIQANREVLETAARYSFEQGLTPRLMKLEELFAPSLMDQ